MAEKKLRTRMVQKHDTEENWLKASGFVPKQGEIIVYDEDSNCPYERIKIGDGINNVNILPFAHAASMVVQNKAPIDTSVIWVDPDDDYTDEFNITQVVPEFANSIEECTDTTKLYVLPDGYIYAYMLTEVEIPPSYTNLLPLAINADGTPYVGENGEKGYKTGWRLNSRREEEQQQNRCCTGFIPVRNTDIVRLKNMSNDGINLNGAIYFYADDRATNVGIFYEPVLDGSEFVFTPNDLKGFHSANMNAGSSCRYMRISTHVVNDFSIVTVNEEINEGGTTTEYKWTNTGHAFVPADYNDRIIDIENDVTELKNRVTDLEEDSGNSGSGTVTSDSVEILLPSFDVAVVGREYNIYKNVAVFGRKPVEYYDIDIRVSDSSTKAHNYHEVWRYTPTTAGVYTITITVRDRKLGNGAIYATKTMTLKVVENAAISGKHVLFLGDSFTYAGIYPAEIQHNLSNGGIVSVGTLEANRTINGQTLPVKHEGRNGWATWDYAGTWEDSLTKFQSANNVFRNPSTNKFDLAYYMTTYHSGITLDAVCLNLGTNGVGATGINVEGMTELITRIRAYSSTIPILVHIPIAEAPGDFYGYLGGNATNDYMRMRWLELASAFIEKYDGTMTNVRVVPVYINLDDNHDYPTTNMAVSVRNPATIDRITDGHPNTYGYLKMADVYYAHLLYCMQNVNSGATVYSVTNNLTNVSNSNSTKTVYEGDSYTATLTANIGYELDTVSVTMGGQAVTVINGVINIAAVTGAIVITATAKASSTVVNLVDPSTANDASPDTTTLFKDEWLNGHYLSANTIGTEAGCIVTDLFPVKSTQKIKVEGVKVSTLALKNRSRWYLFNADGTKWRGFASYYNFTADENVTNKGTTVVDADNNTYIVDISAAFGLTAEDKDMAYARFSCYPAGANEDIVVTIVE